jgi:nitroreductase
VGSIIPAAWSFMLAARARGLGSVWITFHLRHEREAAELLGIPFEAVMQAALIPSLTPPAPTSGPPPAIPWTRWSLGAVVGRLGAAHR